MAATLGFPAQASPLLFTLSYLRRCPHFFFFALDPVTGESKPGKSLPYASHQALSYDELADYIWAGSTEHIFVLGSWGLEVGRPVPSKGDI
jgi:hypothetical protein